LKAPLSDRFVLNSRKHHLDINFTIQLTANNAYAWSVETRNPITQITGSNTSKIHFHLRYQRHHITLERQSNKMDEGQSLQAGGSIDDTTIWRAFFTTVTLVCHHCIHPPLVRAIIIGVHVAVTGSGITANLNMTFLPISKILGHLGTPNMVGTPPEHLRQMGISGPFPILLPFDKAANDTFRGLYICPATAA